MKAIADASSLIVLVRQNALGMLERVFGQVGLVPGVESETVTQGKARGYADAKRIEAAIEAGQLIVISPSAAEKRLATSIGQRTPGLSRTDCMTLACANSRGLVLIMEDQRGRTAAVARRITCTTIQVLPLQGLIDEQLSFAECEELLIRIGGAMRTDQSVLTVLRAAAGEIQRLRSGQRESLS